MSISTTSTIALLVDYENVAKPETTGLEAIVAQATREGSVVLRRAYANWVRFASHKPQLRSAGFEMIDVASTNGKNSVDIKLVVDAMEIAFTKTYIDTFVIVSGDSDFIPLVIKLNELNRRAWLCTANKQLSPAIDKFCFRMPIQSKSPKSSQSKTVQSKTNRSKSSLKIGPTIPKTRPVPSFANKREVAISAIQLELLQLAIEVCDLSITPPLPLGWLFAVVRVLDPQFVPSSCVGAGKRPHVRIAQHLQQLGEIELSFDERQMNYTFSPTGNYPPSSPATAHPKFQASVEHLQQLVAGRQDQRFRLRQTLVSRQTEPVEVASQFGLQAIEPTSIASMEPTDCPHLLLFSFE